MDLSIIIVNYNSKDFLCNCVRSIIDHLHAIQYEIIVVDNLSSDDSYKRCQEIDDSHIFCIQAGQNLGFSKANNLGASHAKGRVLHFLNPDTQIGPTMQDDYKQVLSDVDKGNRAVYINPLQNRDGSVCYGRNALPGTTNWIKYYLCREKTQWYYIGASIIISMDDFNKIGKWNERIFMYYEDADIFCRINSSGIRSVELPSVIYHYGGGTSEHSFTNLQREVLIQKGMRIYRDSNKMNRVDFWCWQTLVVLTFWRRPKRMWWQIKAIYQSLKTDA